MERITSRQNKLMQHIRKLQSSRSYRYQCGQFVAEGTKLLDEAVRWYEGLDTVVVQDGVTVSVPDRVRVVEVPVDLMRSISNMDTPQGALFICNMPEQAEVDMQGGCLVLDGIQDPGNLGTILRTADALEIPVYLTEGCADPYSDKTVRATMGAVFRCPVWNCDADALRALLTASELPLYGAALRADTLDARTVDYSRCAIAIGSEGKGLSEAMLDRCDQTVLIPMQAHCESLNAAIAATVLLWEAARND